MLLVYTLTTISTALNFSLYLFKNHHNFSKHYCHYYCSTPIFLATNTSNTTCYIKTKLNNFYNNYYAPALIFYIPKSYLSFVQSTICKKAKGVFGIDYLPQFAHVELAFCLSLCLSICLCV